jgi:PucR family transcriptional regulator, purine catabolism regulatory protein
MEVPDIIKWLKGNELILTSFYPIKDDLEAQKNLVRQLYEVGSAALAIKPHRFVNEIPQAVLEEAEKYGFPIIEIPEQVSYMDILIPVMNTIFDTKVVLQKDLEMANQLLLSISLNSSGIERFIESLSHLTKNQITVESLYSFIKVPPSSLLMDDLSNDQVQELNLINRPIRLSRKLESQEVECIVAPILLEGKVFGTITCWGINKDHLEIDLAILERASTLLALEFLRLKAKNDVELEYKSEFLRDLILNDDLSIEDLQERGEKYRFVSGLHYVCLIIHFNVDHQQEDYKLELMNRIESSLHYFRPNAITGYIRKSLCILYPLVNTDYDEIINESESVYKHLKKTLNPSHEFHMAVGRYLPGIKGLRDSFHDAENAILLGKSLWEDRHIIHYNDLGVYLLIAQNPNNNLLKEFFGRTVGVLDQYDENNSLDLVKTLRTYFQQDEALTKTASVLYVHVNTVKYRIRKIEQLTGLSLQNSEGKLMLHMGLKVFDFLKSRYRPM